ncbi:hypothetical protein HD554DRAFT_2329754 [Boletus coccyginus]|nr:hypothetical protein HD554DRAFT_2329754 [Boletus coccyginus]
MSIVGNAVQNVGNDLFADLQGGGLAPGTPVIVFNGQPDPQAGLQNQRWRFIPVDAAQNVYLIQSVWSGAYASVNAIVAGSAVVSNAIPFNWQVLPVNRLNANRSIGVPGTNLVWNAGAASGDDITIEVAANIPDQQWIIAA